MDTRNVGFSTAQLRYLNERFPNRCVQPGMSQEQAWLEAGARRVIDHIAALIRKGATDLDIDADGIASARPTARRK
jgi:hypothetical protein